MLWTLNILSFASLLQGLPTSFGLEKRAIAEVRLTLRFYVRPLITSILQITLCADKNFINCQTVDTPVNDQAHTSADRNCIDLSRVM